MHRPEDRHGKISATARQLEAARIAHRPQGTAQSASTYDAQQL
jgi:hypothetical protein